MVGELFIGRADLLFDTGDSDAQADVDAASRADCSLPCLKRQYSSQNGKSRPALFSAGRLSGLWGSFRFPGSAASSAFGITTASWGDYMLRKAAGYHLPGRPFFQYNSTSAESRPEIDNSSFERNLLSSLPYLYVVKEINPRDSLFQNCSKDGSQPQAQTKRQGVSSHGHIAQRLL